MTKARERYKAKSSMDKRYVNVFGCSSSDKRLATVFAELAKAGFEAFTSQVPGPLLRATHGKLLLHMPIDPGSTYEKLHQIFDDA